jgi:hypothetical protein
VANFGRERLLTNRAVSSPRYRLAAFLTFEGETVKVRCLDKPLPYEFSYTALFNAGSLGHDLDRYFGIVLDEISYGEVFLFPLIIAIRA